MKTILLVFYLLLLTNSKGQTVFDTAFIRATTYNHISALAHDSMQGRLSGTTEALKATFYIVKKFDSLGLKNIFGEENYLQEIVTTNTFYGYNVIGTLYGKDTIKKDSILIFSAHYDHVGSSYNGANDNATGTAALLTIAEYYKSISINGYTLLFIAFSGEEQGMIGSRHFIKQFPNLKIKQVFNLEMLGRGKASKYRPYITGMHSDKITKRFNKILNEKNALIQRRRKVKYFIDDPFPMYKLNERSDHYSFNLKKVNAVTIMNSSPIDIHYHQPTDELQTIDFETMKQTIWYIIQATSEFVK